MAMAKEMDAKAREQIDKLELYKMWTDLDVDGIGNISLSDVRKYKLFKGVDVSNYFSKMDYNDDGEVTPGELAHYTLINRLGRKPTEAELSYATQMIRVNPIIFTRIPYMAKKWSYYDIDNSGSISKSEIATRIAVLHKHIEEQARHEMIEDAAKELIGDLDLDNDGKVSKTEYMENELCRLLHRKPREQEMTMGLAAMEELIKGKK